MAFQPLNNATGALASDHLVGSGTLALKSGEGARFGTPSVDSPVRVTVARLPTLVSGRIESTTTKTIFDCTVRTGDTLSGLTTAEGTSDQRFYKNDPVAVLITAGTLSELQTVVTDAADVATEAAAAVAGKADDDAVVKLVGAQTIAGAKTFASTVATPTVDHGVQAGTLLAPTPQTLWQHQPRDPAFGPWHCHSGGAFFSSVWDPVLYFGYNSHFAADHNPDEPSCTLNFEVNYFESETSKTTFECYNEFLSADETLRVRPWMFTLDKATGSNRFAINIGPASSFGDYRIVSLDTILYQLDGGGISGGAVDTVAKYSWSSLETFVYTANSLGSTLALKGTPAKLHLDHGNSIVQWSNQWNVNINNADNLLYVRDMLNSRNHVVYTGASTSAVALTTFNSRVVANGQVTIINGAPLNFAARGKLFGFGPSTQPVDNYTSYLSFSASGTAADCTINFDLTNGTPTGHVTPLSLRGDNTVAVLGNLLLPTSADAAIPNGGMAWSSTTVGALKARTTAGVLKTIAFEP